MHNALDIENLSHEYDGTPILYNIDMNIAAGEAVCLLGPSGSGKSTMLRIISGLERARSGNDYKITAGGDVVAAQQSHMPPQRRRIAMMFQQPSLFPHMTALENICFAIDRGTKAQKRIPALKRLKSVGLEERAHAYPHQLSGGQQQRVALARAVAARPELILLDEPFANLDARLREHVRDETFDMLRQHRISTLLVTHDPHEALTLSDRIYIIEDGHITQHGTAQELHDAPKTPFVVTLFGAACKMSAHVRGELLHTPFGMMPVSDLATQGMRHMLLAAGEYEMYIRSHNITVNTLPECDDMATAQVRIKSCKHIGGQIIYDVQLEDSNVTLRAICDGRSDMLVVGQQCYAHIRPRDCFIFRISSSAVRQ